MSTPTTKRGTVPWQTSAISINGRGPWAEAQPARPYDVECSGASPEHSHALRDVLRVGAWLVRRLSLRRQVEEAEKRMQGWKQARSFVETAAQKGDEVEDIIFGMKKAEAIAGASLEELKRKARM